MKIRTSCEQVCTPVICTVVQSAVTTVFRSLLKLSFFCKSEDLSTKNYIPIKLQLLLINLKFIP